MVYQRSGAGNRHFCNLLARLEDYINVILSLFFTGNAIQNCYGLLKSTGGRSKNGIFRVHTVKNDRNRHENDVICGPSLCFVSHVWTESAIFAPATGRLDTALTAVYGISSEKYLNIILIWSSILANQSQKCRFPAPEGAIILILCPE